MNKLENVVLAQSQCEFVVGIVRLMTVSITASCVSSVSKNKTGPVYRLSHCEGYQEGTQQNEQMIQVLTSTATQCQCDNCRLRTKSFDSTRSLL